MAGKWFIFLNGVISGPYEESLVKDLIINGALTIADKISREEEFSWQNINCFEEFADLFDEERPAGDDGKDTFVKDFVRQAVAGEFPDAGEQRFDSGVVRLSCPHCGQHYKVDFTLCRGQVIACQECGKNFVLNLQSEVIKAAALYVPEEEPGEITIKDLGLPAPETLSGEMICPHCGKSFPADRQ